MADRRPRLLQVAATFPPYAGGVETHTHEVTRRLAAGFDVTVLSTDPLGRSTPRGRTDDGVELIRVPAWPRDGDLFFAPGLLGVIASRAWDLVHLQGYHTLVAPLAMAGAIRARLPFLVTLHSGGHASAARRALRLPQHLVLRPLLLQARRIVAVSRFERDAYARRLGLARRRFTVIPNGSDLPTPDGGVHRNGTLLLSVGRLERYKGHHRLVDALPLVARRRPDVRLRIAGAGPDRSFLEERAQALGVRDRVTIEGVDPADRLAMAHLYAQASVVALLSDYESHGLAAIEAASAGRPLVVADATALHDLVAAGSARGVRPDSSPQELADALLTELETPRAAAPAPTWDDCAAALERLYHDVLGDAA